MRQWTLALAVAGVLAVASASRAASVIFKAGFEEDSSENFTTSFAGGTIAPSDYDFSVGKAALKCTVETVTDAERYIKYTEAGTRIGFHYKACGVRTIRVLGGSIEDSENLYITLTNVPQNVWSWAVVKVADWKNMIPRNGGPDCPAGDKTGKGKTFRNVVFHLMDPVKENDQPTVYLDNIVLFSGADTTAPTLTGKPAVHADAQGRLLSWPDAKDDVGVACYRVIRAGSPDFAAGVVTNTVVAPEFPLDAKKAWYRVVAVDYAGNASQPSEPVAVEAK
jgi:hypothetical protein